MIYRKRLLASVAVGLAASLGGFAVQADEAKKADEAKPKETTQAPAERTEGHERHGEREGRPGAGRPGEGGPGEGRPVESPEARRARSLKELDEQVGGLTDDQKTRVMAVYETSAKDIATIRADTSLSEEQQQIAIRAVQAQTPIKISEILNDTQRAKWKQAVAERDAKAKNPQLNGGLLPGETVEQRRGRLLKEYEEAKLNLTAEQKTQILAVLEPASDVLAALAKDDSRTEEQKTGVRNRIQEGVDTKIDAILTKTQRRQWQKAQAERLKQAPRKPVKN